MDGSDFTSTHSHPNRSIVVHSKWNMSRPSEQRTVWMYTTRSMHTLYNSIPSSSSSKRWSNKLGLWYFVWTSWNEPSQVRVEVNAVWCYLTALAQSLLTALNPNKICSSNRPDYLIRKVDLISTRKLRRVRRHGNAKRFRARPHVRTH